MMRRESGSFLIWSHDLADLVDVTPVRRRPGAPLVTVHRPEIAVCIGPLVPDGDLVVVQVTQVGVALQEPQQLMNDGAQVAFLGGHQRKAVGEVKAHLVAKDTDRARAGAVLLAGTVVTHMAHQVEILFHGCLL